jgi:ankyrin repeat protein
MSIWDAAEAGDLAEVQWLVGQNPRRLNARDHQEWTPLMRASRNGHDAEVVRWLVDRRAALDERNHAGVTGLASSHGHIFVVHLLLQRGAYPILVDTPLIHASTEGHVETVRCLLDHRFAGRIINQRDWGDRTALSWACANGHVAVVILLLERGADPTVADRDGLTPLVHALKSEHLESVRCLLDHPSAAATISQRDRWARTALSWACVYGREGAVRALLEKGADPTIVDTYGMTPMAMAKRQNHPACVEALKVSGLFVIPFSHADHADCGVGSCPWRGG